MKLLIIIIILGVTSAIINSQEINKLPVADSIKIDNNSPANLFFKFDEFEFYRDLTKLKHDFNVDNETAKLWLEVSLDLSNNSSFNKEDDYTPVYLHSSLYDQYLEDSKFNPFRTALGMIEAGAVGYLAYRHIKKWVIKK